MQHFFREPSTWLSIISIVIALWSTILTRKQIKLSNKHQLFERRLNIYLIITDLLETYNNEIKKIDFSAKSIDYSDVSLKFMQITNNNYLQDLQDISFNPLEEASEKKLLKKLDDMKRISNEIYFVFPKKEEKIIRNFMNAYIQILLEWHSYMSFLKIRIEPQNSIREIIFKKIYNVTENEIFEQLTKINNELDKTANELQEKRIVKKIKKCILLTRN